MEIFSWFTLKDREPHGLYGGAIILKKSPSFYWVGVLSGMSTDIVACSFRLYKAGVKKALPSFLGIRHDLPASSYTVYYITHSFITALCLFLVLFLIHRDFAILALPYAFHILCDKSAKRFAGSTRDALRGAP